MRVCSFYQKAWRLVMFSKKTHDEGICARSNTSRSAVARRNERNNPRRFLLLAFLFAPTSRKRKAANDLVRLTFNKGKPPLVRFPSFVCDEIHPFVALANAMGVSSSAELDQGSAFGYRNLSRKLDQSFQSISPTNTNLTVTYF